MKSYGVTFSRLREEIAEHLRCDAKKVTLTLLAQSVPLSQQGDVVECQTRLRSLIGQFKREYMLTSLLIADCARFNRSLMRACFGLTGRGNVTYSPSGAAQPQSGTALMNLQF